LGASTTPKEPKAAMADIYAEFFRLGLAKSDFTSTTAEFKSLLTRLSVNTAQVDNYVAALKAYLDVVVENPTEAQKTAMTEKLNLFDTAEETFVKSFEGLEAALANPFFATDPNNAGFNGYRAAASSAKTGLRVSPQTTYSFFTSPTTVSVFVDYTFSAIEVSNRLKSGG
jgi:hypothetical protein